jgi:mono/diheme cytochrome c family protein
LRAGPRPKSTHNGGDSEPGAEADGKVDSSDTISRSGFDRIPSRILEAPMTDRPTTSTSRWTQVVTGAAIVASAAFTGLALPAQQPADGGKAFQDSVVARQKSIDAGRHVFHGEGTCFGCHGPNLEGTAIAPTLRAHKWRNGDGGLEMIMRVIRNGVPNTAMISRPGGINDSELAEVAAYVWAVSRGAAKP